MTCLSSVHGSCGVKERRRSNAILEEFFPGLVIDPVNPGLAAQAQAHLDSLTKPVGSLGRMEEIARRLFAVAQGQTPLAVSPAVMFVVAADHGVAEQGVSPFPQSVTRQMVRNFLNGGAAVNALCREAGMDLRIVDAGCAGGAFSPHPFLLDRRLGDGTADMSQGQAMSREACIRGLAEGVKLAFAAEEQGYRCLGIGEMGIANTTAAAAVYCALLDLEPSRMVGPGAGADAAMIRHKADIVRQALEVNAATLAAGDALTVLACLGGFELAVMCGIMLGGAARHLPVLVDGFISSAAYAAGTAICPYLAEYGFLAHASAEPGHQTALAQFAVRPLLQLDMRLGEGTGAAAAYPLLRGAAAIYNGMATFASAGVAGRLK